MKTVPLRSAFFHAYGQTDTTKLTAAFRKIAAAKTRTRRRITNFTAYEI